MTKRKRAGRPAVSQKERGDESITNRIMDEWGAVCDYTRTSLDGHILKDTQSPHEREMGDIIFIIQRSFALNDGKTPSELASCAKCAEASAALEKARVAIKNEMPGREGFRTVLDRVKEIVTPELFYHGDDECEGDGAKLWDYPRFAAEVAKSAKIQRRSTRELMQGAMRKVSAGGREAVFEELFGPGYRAVVIKDFLTLAKPRGRKKESSRLVKEE